MNPDLAGTSAITWKMKPHKKIGLKKYQPLTAMGLCVFALAVYLLLYPASEQYDLLASIIGGFLLVTFGILLLLFIHTIKRLPNTGSSVLLGKRGIPGYQLNSRLSIPEVFLAPFMRMEFNREFVSPGLKSTSLRFVGGKVEHFNETFVAEHRGCWKSEGLVVTVGDSLGFFSLKRFIRSPLEVLCFPMQENLPHIPVTPSAFQTGDLSHPNAPKSGDPLDIKSYHKSDGINRIMWKLFAKSGELFVRVPEQAVYPESELHLYLIAKVEEDMLAAQTWEFVKQLASRNIRVKFGTDLLPGVYGNFHLNRVEEELSKLELMIASSGTSDSAGTGRGFDSFKNQIAADTKVLVLCSSLSPALRNKMLGQNIEVIELNEK